MFRPIGILENMEPIIEGAFTLLSSLISIIIDRDV